MANRPSNERARLQYVERAYDVFYALCCVFRGVFKKEVKNPIEILLYFGRENQSRHFFTFGNSAARFAARSRR
ncbi:hypothetical protein BN2476_1290025 [Paraburkholderia piptadeniae]|uniref:Uncharacterized protein n=1 Tax=Paraburkholderia piptadeniae TaxID=1701573 RepID=A0A1N7SWF6_9BURK|nr:hypothetical protein BN2476_1290025 [Paraburkholderia piptadeniae]